MKRRYWSAALAALLLLTGCGASKPAGEPMPSTQENRDPSRERKTEVALVQWQDAKFLKAVVSRSQRFGSVHSAELGAFPEGEGLETFVEAFRAAEQMEGQLDIAKPEYDVSFVGGDGEADFHLWLGRTSGTKGLYTYVEDTGAGYTLSEEDTDRLRELIRSLDYTPDQAVANGEIVNLHGKLTGLNKWAEFVEQVKSGTPGEAHLVDYTIEGDPIFRDLLFDGQVIQYTYDNSMDGFGSPERRVSFCKNLDRDGERYTLSKCDRDESWVVLDARVGD